MEVAQGTACMHGAGHARFAAPLKASLAHGRAVVAQKADRGHAP